MRTLVEQTRDKIFDWLKNLLRATDAETIHISPEAREQLVWLCDHSPVTLMGGEAPSASPTARDWHLYPERPAILIGTQDMLLSRALNRGYGMSRATWSMHFALLNNDALWLLDETQLMGAGLPTSAQLEAFRNQFGTFPVQTPPRPSATWYLSATADPAQLQTREWRTTPTQRPADFHFSLSATDRAADRIAPRLHARKQLELCENQNFSETLPVHAAEILRRHREMLANLSLADPAAPRRTLIIVNTVKRAVALFTALKTALDTPAKNSPAASTPTPTTTPAPALLLLHSRFRPHEREAQREALSAPIPAAGQIVVATQFIEAVVDISSALLWTEVAPLASLVQRLGRLNRAGEFNDTNSFVPLCIVFGLDTKTPTGTNTEKAEIEKANAKKCLPYTAAACAAAFETLRHLPASAASPAALAAQSIADAVAASIPHVPYSLQRHELLDFFDTDANLSLGFTDVSPFVRGLDEDTDAHVLWRDKLNTSDTAPSSAPDFQHAELCAIPISQARDAAAERILNQGWFYRGKKAGWASVRDTGVFPGMTIVLPTNAGGYSAQLGWTADPNDKPADIHEPRETPPDEDLLAFITHGWQNITEHTADVRATFADILRALPAATLTTAERTDIERGIDWHDIGKNHPHWQTAAATVLEKAQIPEAHFTAKLPLAKFSLRDSPLLRDADGQMLTRDALKDKIRELKNNFRPHVTHEVASALAFRQHDQQTTATNVSERSEQASLASPTTTAAAPRPLESLLAEYLIMSHHGHVRKVLRDELPREPHDAKDTETVRGIANGDALPPITINGTPLGCAALSTDCRRMGRDATGHESYTRGVLRLLEHYGPFRLAYLETLFRAADCRASQSATQHSAQP
jgi:CRISPR-associated endonuclease/helicase Cas3